MGIYWYTDESHRILCLGSVSRQASSLVSLQYGKRRSRPLLPVCRSREHAHGAEEPALKEKLPTI